MLHFYKQTHTSQPNSGSNTLQFQKICVVYYAINRHWGHQHLGRPEIPTASLVGLN